MCIIMTHTYLRTLSIPALPPYGKLAPTTDHDSDDETALDSNTLRSFLDDLLHEREFNKEIELALQRSDAALQLVQLFHWSEKWTNTDTAFGSTNGKIGPCEIWFPIH